MADDVSPLLSAELKALAAAVTPQEAAEFLSRCAACLRVELQATGSNRPAGGASTSRLALVVRGDSTVRRFHHAGPAAEAVESGAAWVIEHWALKDDRLGGEVSEVQTSEALGCSTRVEVASCQVLLDLVTGRQSPLTALARRRLSTAGDLASARRLRPVVQRAVQRALQDFQAEGGPRALRRDLVEPTSQLDESMGSSSTWMPNDASPGCVLCGKAWKPIIRQRHHCRACGLLVCGRCSAKGSLGRGSRRCLRCQGGVAAAPIAAAAERLRGQSTFSNTSAISAASQDEPSNSFVMTYSHEASFEQAASAAAQEPLPGQQAEGLLYAQIQAALAPELQSSIEASKPSELAKELWGRLLAAEAQAKAARDRPGAGQVLISIVCETLKRAVFLAFLLCTLCFTWQQSTNGDGDLSPYLLDFALPAVSQLNPRWCFVSIIVASFALAVRRHPAYRYLWRLAYIYVTSVVPISIYFFCKQWQKALKLSDQKATELLYDRADRFVAPFLAQRFSALGGLFIKAGQFLANMSYVTPLVWQEHLKPLQDCAPVDSEAHVRRLIQEEFGQTLEDAFLEFCIEPVASASLAQVHRGVMRSSGQQVAVKLQHEGIGPKMLSDLAALKRIVRFCCWLGGSTWDDVMRTSESWMNEMVHELDFTKEVENLREVRLGLEAGGVDVVVPREIDGWVSQRAFVMEFCEGFRITDRDQLALNGVDKRSLAARAVQAVATQLLEIGVFNSDPHAGNLLCQVRGDSTAVPVLLDFGNCIRLPESQRIAYCDLLVSLSTVSVTTVFEALSRLGITTSQSENHPARDMEWIMMVFRDTGNRDNQKEGMKKFKHHRKSQRQSDIEALEEELKGNKKKAKAMTQRYPTHMPDEAVLFFRMMLLVRGLCVQLDAQLPMMQIFEMHARRALVARFPRATRTRHSLPEIGGESWEQGSHPALQQLLRQEISRCCKERAGLGVQVCIYVGEACVVDECGGVLGTVDPRPMALSTQLPLADLARLPWLLALYAAEKKGRLSYQQKLASIMADIPSSQVTLGHALAHQAVKPSGTARETLLSSTFADLKKSSVMRTRFASAVSERPPENGSARRSAYLPLGMGHAAEAALRSLGSSSRGTEVRDILKEHLLLGRPYPEGCLEELALASGERRMERASLASSLFADLRSLSSSGGGSAFMGPFLTGGGQLQKDDSRPSHLFTDASEGGRTNEANGEKKNGEQPPPPGGFAKATLASSVFEAASGLLADVGLADKAAAELAPEACPDLAWSASARSLAAVLAAVSPATDPRPALGREAEPGDSSGSPGANPFDSLLAQLAPPPRAWDERGLQVLELDGCETAAFGLSSCGGFLGLALQWPPEAAAAAGGSNDSAKVVSAVVLCNELSMAAVPSQLMSLVAESLRLPSPLLP